jgi:putative endonuclease
VQRTTVARRELFAQAGHLRQYYLYIMSSRSGVLYVGVTNDLRVRVWQHKAKVAAGFTERYNVDLLVYYETFTDIRDAIFAEKKVKGWRREKKIALIQSKNPTWRDLSENGYGAG